MKKIALFLIGSLMFFLAVGNVYAKEDYVSAYTVGANGSEVQKDVFSWNEKPWLFLELPDIEYQLSTTVSVWDWLGDNNGNGGGNGNKKGQNYITTPDLDPLAQDGNKIWLSFSDQRWNEFKQKGAWLINPISVLLHGNHSTHFVTGQANCTVTPEPISCTLFLLGGGALFAARKRKKA